MQITVKLLEKVLSIYKIRLKNTLKDVNNTIFWLKDTIN